MPRAIELRLPPGPEPSLPRDRERILAAAEGFLARSGGPRARIADVRLQRVSFDARRRERNWLVRATLYLEGEQVPPAPATAPPRLAPARADAPLVVVVGAGPAGLFCALDLAAGGVRVAVLDRGGDVRERRRPLARLNRGQGVDPESNYCFGEGGAGTYSDGKLYTRAGRRSDARAVLEALVAHGAPPAILTGWRPHVGSNKLPGVVRAIRETLVGAGAEVRFHARVEELLVEGAASGRRVAGVRARDLADPSRRTFAVPAAAVVLAPGHSARDSLELAARAGARLEPKGFALGVRAEHPQPWLDELQYGGLRTECDLPAAFYELVLQVQARGVYSFCMCPGGWIVPSTTAEDRAVVNGMSLSRRDSPFANSGIVVQVEPEDWCGERARAAGWAELVGGAPRRPEDEPLLGVRIQEELERRCAAAAGGRVRAPGQRIDAFLAGRAGAPLPPSSYRPGVVPADLARLLPPALAERLREAIVAYDHRLPGFASDAGLLVAPESRTSSPVRLARDRGTGEALSAEGGPLAGLHPCGEGAGFAGGIVSAAVDGRRAAARLLERLG